MAAFRRKHLGNHGVAEVVTLATLTAMVAYFNRFLRLDMTESMAILFRECEGGGNINNLCLWAQFTVLISSQTTDKPLLIGRRLNGVYLTLSYWQLSYEWVWLCFRMAAKFLQVFSSRLWQSVLPSVEWSGCWSRHYTGRQSQQLLLDDC